MCFNSQRDGILRGAQQPLASLSEVSIPNGMEFYSQAGRCSRGKTAFQFPTGWNSTVRNLSSLLRNLRVSIPNGMEFYQNQAFLHACKYNVSIPNGMEFYSRVFGGLRWNLFVSIPNGMEFYAVSCVLRIAKEFYVSIPNGMEFYSICAAFIIGTRSVSIPNGMEFYLEMTGDSYIVQGFNSQRDGILQNRPFLLVHTIRMFQFPTVWNSTDERLCYECKRCRVSIPNGMEFY